LRLENPYLSQRAPFRLGSGQVRSRRGADFTDRFSGVAEAVCGLSVDRALIDGEAVVLRDDGRGDFGALTCPLRRRIGSRDELRRHWRCGSERRVIKSGKVFLRGAGRGFPESPSSPSLPQISGIQLITMLL
jgi:hypothetical protein